MKIFLVYWTREQLSNSLRIGCLPHAGGGQLKRISVGDRLWICGRAESSMELFTVGFIDVAEKLPAKAAQAAMNERLPGYTIWAAPWHVFARKGGECATRLLSLKSLYSKLSFESQKSPQLQIKHGHPNAQQLQTIRQLTDRSAAFVQSLWGSSAVASATSPAANEPPLDLDVLDAHRTTLARLEQHAARDLLLNGQSTARCSFCGRELPAALLVAAHIKPRAACTLEEKRKIAVNIIGLCKLGCDDLFERGYVDAVDGIIVKGSAAPITSAVAIAVSELLRRRVNGWTMDREPFFAWRRNNRTKNAT